MPKSRPVVESEADQGSIGAMAVMFGRIATGLGGLFNPDLRRDLQAMTKGRDAAAILVLGPDGRIRRWSKGCETLYGYSSRVAIGSNPVELLRSRLPTDPEMISAELSRSGAWTGEVRQTTQDREYRWVQVHAARLADSPRGMGRTVETHTDVTARKAAEEALQTSQAQLALAVATYGLGIATHDFRSGEITYSAEFETIAGVQPGELYDPPTRFFDMLLPDDRERVWRHMADDILQRVPRRIQDYRFRRADGEIRHMREVILYDYNQAGRLKLRTTIAMDVSEHYRAREELVSRADRLQQLSSMLSRVTRLGAMGEMASTLAHELNQPLTAVANSAGAIDLILGDGEKPLDEVGRKRILRAARHANTQSVRAGEILRRLREFITRGEADTQFEDLESLIDDAVALALPNPPAADITLLRSIAPEATKVLADRVQVQQVVVNLVRNAVEAMSGQDGRKAITISAETEDGMALISIADTGVGLTPEAREKLFAPFNTTKQDGMGVGLSICKRIIEAHGGRLWFQPATGGGAEFRFTLPISSPEPPQTPVQAQTAQGRVESLSDLAAGDLGYR